MKKIPLTQGKYALVDDADYEWLSQWRWRVHNKPDGQIYARTSIKINNKWTTVFMHRLIMKPHPHLEVDHINRNGLDNRRENLRICTRRQNLFNAIGKIKSTSKYKGVSWSSGRKKWCVSIFANGRAINLGRYNNEIEAAKVYDQAAKKYFGEYARINIQGE